MHERAGVHAVSIVVLLLLAGCSVEQTTSAEDAATGGDDQPSEANLAPAEEEADRPAVAADEFGSGVFTFADDDLCAWVSEEDVAAFVAQAYGRQGVEWDGDAPAVSPQGSAWDDQAWGPEEAYCRWEPTGGGYVIARHLPSDVVTGLIEPFWGDLEFGAVSGHPDLAVNIVVANEAFGRYAFWVDGSEEVLGLEVVLAGLDQGDRLGQEWALLDIADGFLFDLGWTSARAVTEPRRSEVFDFATDELCKWITADDVTRLVAAAYQEHGATPVPGPYWDAKEPDSGSGITTSGCIWEIPGVSRVGLDLVAPDAAAAEGDREFTSHDALSDGVGVNGRLEVGSHDDWVPVLEVRLSVEGHQGQLEFWHQVPAGFEGNTDAVLAIADGLLREMGWIPVA